MSVTRANVESVLIRRVGAWLTAAGLDGTTVNGTNADLNDPIAQALLQAGYSVADITSVTSTDLAAVPDANVPMVLDLAELRALETTAQALSSMEVSGFGFSVKTSSGVNDAIARLIARLRQRYGIGGGALTGGTLSLDFAETHAWDT